MKLSELICCFVGCKIEPMIVEDESTICTRGCKRCGAGYGPWFWKNIPPPPIKGQTREEATAEWGKYIDKRCEEIRNTGSLIHPDELKYPKKNNK